MRIQEMRSGLPHLRKKMTAGQQNNFFAAQVAKEAFIESLTEFIQADEPEVVPSDIEQAIWSVVSFNKIEAADLTYSQAAELIGELDANGENGLCIVTNEAARKISKT